MEYSTVIFITIVNLLRISMGLYIKLDTQEQNNTKNELSVFKQKLGLMNKTVKHVKSHEEPGVTMHLLGALLAENPNHSSNSNSQKRIKDLKRVYSYMHHQMKQSEGTLKTSLNFEVAETSEKRPKRHRRKIAVKMTSEIPTEELDDLLQMFNEKHGIVEESSDEDYGDYNDYPMKLPSATDPDHMYENLYEDEVDLAIPAKSRHSSEYGSFQDLILQASRSQWQRDIDETKLHALSSKHFI